MPNSTRSSAACGSFPQAECPACAGDARICWRPSRWLATALPVLGALAAVSLLVSDLPVILAAPAALLALAGAARSWQRERSRAPVSFVFRRGAPPQADGEAVAEFALHWRGPLAFVRWRDGQGRRHHRAWWPDTLPAAQRRELRLAAPATRDAGDRASMAP